jgi:oligopeptide/dipeptide ABC transporter ATP-binding protein
MRTDMTALQTKNLVKHFNQEGRNIQAVQNVDIFLMPSEIVGLVGESGSGKSTVGKLLTGILKADQGHIDLFGRALDSYPAKDRSKAIQMIFQDWQSSLNPKMRVKKILQEGWKIHNDFSSPEEMAVRLEKLCHDCEISKNLLSRFPGELSGGQMQRVSIARALSLNPKILIADEPTSSLDIPIRHQILALLRKIKEENNIAVLLISHDLDAVKKIADRIYIMFRGKIVETSSTQRLFAEYMHPYTERLLGSLARIQNGEWNRINETVAWNQGCPFTKVCKNVMPVCEKESPPWKDFVQNHQILCHIDTSKISSKKS